MTKKPEKRETEPELRPDGWDRFEKAVDVAVKPRLNLPSKQKDRTSSVEKAEKPHDKH
jgi:hypothetical protein